MSTVSLHWCQPIKARYINWTDNNNNTDANQLNWPVELSWVFQTWSGLQQHTTVGDCQSRFLDMFRILDSRDPVSFMSANQREVSIVMLQVQLGQSSWVELSQRPYSFGLFRVTPVYLTSNSSVTRITRQLHHVFRRVETSNTGTTRE